MLCARPFFFHVTYRSAQMMLRRAIWSCTACGGMSVLMMQTRYGRQSSMICMLGIGNIQLFQPNHAIYVFSRLAFGQITHKLWFTSVYTWNFLLPYHKISKAFSQTGHTVLPCVPTYLFVVYTMHSILQLHTGSLWTYLYMSIGSYV